MADFILALEKADDGSRRSSLYSVDYNSSSLTTLFQDGPVPTAYLDRDANISLYALGVHTPAGAFTAHMYFHEEVVAGDHRLRKYEVSAANGFVFEYDVTLPMDSGQVVRCISVTQDGGHVLLTCGDDQDDKLLLYSDSGTAFTLEQTYTDVAKTEFRIAKFNPRDDYIVFLSTELNGGSGNDDWVLELFSFDAVTSTLAFITRQTGYVSEYGLQDVIFDMAISDTGDQAFFPTTNGGIKEIAAYSFAGETWAFLGSAALNSNDFTDISFTHSVTCTPDGAYVFYSSGELYMLSNDGAGNLAEVSNSGTMNDQQGEATHALLVSETQVVGTSHLNSFYGKAPYKVFDYSGGTLVEEAAHPLPLDTTDADYIYQLAFYNAPAKYQDDTVANMTIAEVLGVQPHAYVTDAFTIGDTVDSQIQVIARELVSLSGFSTTSGSTLTTDVTEGMVIDALGIVPILVELIEAFAASDGEQIVAYKMVTGAEQFLSAETVETQATYNLALAIALLARDQFETVTNVTLGEVLTAAAEHTAGLKLILDTLEAIAADAVFAQNVILAVDTAEDTDVADVPSTLANLILDLEEGGAFYVNIRVGNDVIAGWVVNTENFAFSEYTNFPFNSLVSVGGQHFAIAEDGLYELTGNDDDGTPIEASIRTGLLSMGTHYLKDAKAAHLGYTSTGKLVLKVATTAKGQKEEWWYELKQGSATSVRDGRVTIGRGLRAKYWQFEVVNKDGADFELDDIQVMYNILKRRI